jgi:uncharacterized MAPEG superfamily protein
MTIPLWCLLGGALLPYIWAGVSVPFRSKQFGKVDLVQPRLQAADLTDAGAGAWGAQMNAWEALAIYMAASLAAFMQGVDPAGSWATASMVWLGARALHGVFYVAGIAPLRVLCFVIGTVMALWIFFMAASV